MVTLNLGVNQLTMHDPLLYSLMDNPAICQRLANAGVLLLPLQGGCDDGHDDDPLQWLRDSIPGEPGVDYPLLSSPDPDATFSCLGLVPGGYYADVDQRCQVFHVCLLPGEELRASFICPNGTIFAQV